MYVVDSPAWIGYLQSTPGGLRAARIIEDPESELVTPEPCLAEVRSWTLREGGKSFDPMLAVICQNSTIEPVGADLWIRAAEIRHEMRRTRSVYEFGLLDAVVVAIQRARRCKILTGDSHFKGLKDVVYVGK